MGAKCSTSCSKPPRQRLDCPAPVQHPEKQPSERPKPRSWLHDKQANEANKRLEASVKLDKEKEVPVNVPTDAENFPTFQRTEVLLSPHNGSEDSEEIPVPKQPKGRESPVRNLLPSFEDAR